MKYRILMLPAIFFLGILGASSPVAVAQNSQPPIGAPAQPPSQPPLTPPAQPRKGGILNDGRNLSNSRETEEAFERLRSLEIRQTEGPADPMRVNELTRNLYRKPNKKELQVLTPSPEQLEKYAAFLNQPDTGIIKLNADFSCAGGRKGNVVVAKETCLPFSMPGGGTSFSFRAETHRLPHLADLILDGNILKTDGVLQQGIMVNLGDVPLEQVTADSKGLKYLIDFQPIVENADALLDFDKRLISGIKSDGYTYGIGFYVKNQSTYALRSVAYKGRYLRAVDGVSYNEMDFDKRKDILVAFRVVEQEEGSGNVTIVWKILSRKDPPTWKFKKKKEEN